MKAFLQSELFSQLLKWFVVLLIGSLILVLRQFAAPPHTVDLYLLAGHVAEQLDKLVVGGIFGWMLAEKPRFMRRPTDPEEPDE